jgi:hypothetical protein
MRSFVALLLGLALTACGTPPESNTDAGHEAAASEDASDAQQVEDTAPPEDTGAIDASSDDAVTEDAGADDAPDAAVLEAAVDAGTDAGPADTGPVDAGSCDRCVEGTFRCDPATAGVQRCSRGPSGCADWTTQNTCPVVDDPVTQRERCDMNACALCAIPDGGGPGCAPICTTDAECADRFSRARCVDGFCVRRGYLQCSTAADCTPFNGARTTTGCSGTATTDAGVVRVCNGDSVTWCTSDGMCPRTYRCDLTTGFCVP